MDAYVEVVHEDGRKDRFPIEGAQVTLGKSGTAGISLPTSGELELEHLLIAPRGKEGCWVSTSQGARTPTKMKGKPFESGMVPWNSELTIGSVRIKLTNKKPSKGGGEGPSKVVILGGVAIAAVVAVMFLKPGQESLPSGEGIEPPDLFASLPTTCDDDDAASAAERLEYAAHSRGDRYSYDPQDGVQAVMLYAQAKACYEQAGNSERAEVMEESRQAMQGKVDADFAAIRLRLHHALSVEDWDVAEREAEALDALTSDMPEEDPYVGWLDRVLRIVRANARYRPAEEEG
ncbi:MAG: hypothetical protein JJ863_07635 [Deltaproteobacteria bacterium]|nr:hypothetical protein [Deltaproteobacteria bacterium]